MTLKLVTWKWADEEEVILLDTIETKEEWEAMTNFERRQMDSLLADVDRTIGYLIARDVNDKNFITIFAEDDIVKMVTV